MEIKDLFITPVYLLLLTGLALFLRSSMTNSITRRYFLPALYLKFFGAVMVGVIYQFYYGGGDTFNYYNQSLVFNEPFFKGDINTWFKLLISDGTMKDGDIFPYASRMYWFHSPSEFLMIKIVGLIGIITFNTYSSTALVFAFLSFLGLWKLFGQLNELFPHLHKQIAIAIFFIPSVFFWGSGIFKDTVALGSLGWMLSIILTTIRHPQFALKYSFSFLFFLWLLYSIKIYILLCFLGALTVFLYRYAMFKIANRLLKVVLFPLLLLFFTFIGFRAINYVSSQNSKYSIENIGETARITAYDIGFYTGAGSGSTYDIGIGELDGSIGAMLKLAPQAIIVSIYRPFLWEVRNPLMLLSAIESLFMLGLTLSIFKVSLTKLKKRLNHPFVIFCLVFSFTFAFAVGITTFNFGTLMRYKIPMMPFYVIMIFLLKGDYRSTLNKELMNF